MMLLPGGSLLFVRVWLLESLKRFRVRLLCASPACRGGRVVFVGLGVVLLSVCFVETGHAQGFNTLNGRNHPELQWRVAETEHFQLVYPAHLRGIELEAATIAEASYAALSENLGVTFDRKIRIYLSDEDEILNGFASPIGNGYTSIWVHQNALASRWTGRRKWLRRVIPHELAHIFHYRAVLPQPRWLGFLLGNPLPRFWTEGLAQYQTEEWDALRGDRWLRTAVLEDRLSYRDGRSAWNGRLLYAAGNAQVRYFAAQHGDTTLARLLAHREPALFGLFRVHDFEQAFEATTGQPHRAFYDDWRRHVNVYYNTLASRLETIDSLEATPLPLPGQYLYDVQFSPDTSAVAVVSLASLRRPVRRLQVVEPETERVRTVAEGTLRTPVAWSPDGQRLAFARATRGRHGSILNDLFLVRRDGRGLRRLTHSRRASSPTFAPDGRRIAFIGSEAGTANLFVMDLQTGQETPLTHFTGDVQISSVRWAPSGRRLAFARFAADGRRDVVLLDLATGALRPVTGAAHDDRQPIWSPDGRQLAYTSLRDDVPNVFVLDLASGTHRRVTHLATGATGLDWLPPDSAHVQGTLILATSSTKRRDAAYRLDAGRRTAEITPTVPPAYTAWMTHRPPREVPPALAPDASLIQRRYAYAPWKHLTHVASLVLPYYAGPDRWGLFGLTSWTEPLGKHALAFTGSLAVPAPLARSAFLASYVNNTWHPTLLFNAYRTSAPLRIYGDGLLVEEIGGGDVGLLWPLDWRARPFVRTTLQARLRYADFEPLDVDDVALLDGLPAPEAGQQADLRLAFARRKQRPYRDNLIHPLDGTGIRLQLTGAARVLGADRAFLRADLAAFGIAPVVGLHRLFVYGRAQAQTGASRAQDYLGFSRYDDVWVALPAVFVGSSTLTLGDAERVRGYRAYALGNRMLFGSAEYRVPLLPDLRTRILGVLSFGSTALALFADAGLVWADGRLSEAEQRAGAGLELKNALRLGGVLEIGHALGIGQPVENLGSRDDYDLYYRLRAAVPF